MTKQFCFVKTYEELCVYEKVNENSMTFLVLYVDDVIQVVNDLGMMQSTNTWLSTQFSMNDL